MPAPADLALRTGDLPAVVVDVEVVPCEALVVAVLTGGVARQRPGDGDLVFTDGLFQAGQGGVAGSTRCSAGRSPRWERRARMPGRTWLSWVVAAVVATSVITLGPSGAQVSVR